MTNRDIATAVQNIADTLGKSIDDNSFGPWR